MSDFIEIMSVILIVLFLVVGSIFGLGYVVMSKGCSAYEEATGKPTKMQFLDCYVQDGGNWYVWTEYKYRLVTKGEL